MKATSTIGTSSSHSISLRYLLRAIGAVVGWTILMLATLLTGLLSGWFFLALTLLGHMPQNEVIVMLSVMVAIIVGIGSLLARFITPARSVGRIVGAALVLFLVTWLT